MECCSLMSEDHGGLCTFRGLSGKFVILTSGCWFHTIPYLLLISSAPCLRPSSSPCEVKWVTPCNKIIYATELFPFIGAQSEAQDGLMGPDQFIKSGTPLTVESGAVL